MPEQSETEAVRRILHETLVKNAKAHTDLESVKMDLQAAANGIDNTHLRAELEKIRERCASIKTLIAPPTSDRG